LKPLNGLDFEKEDVCEVIFSHKKTVKACRLFFDWLRTMGGEASRTQVSNFARELASGHISKGFTYKRSNFYRTVLKNLLVMGFISLQPRFDPEKRSETSYVYAPIRQPIPKRPPLGERSFWRLAWEVAKKWNEECER
jgi:hypothetical protein